MDRFAAARKVLERAIDRRVCPGASVEIGCWDRILWRQAFGRLTHEDQSPSAGTDTIYDLASLTKVLATTSLAMTHVDAGRVRLTDRVANRLGGWRGSDRAEVTVAHLLAHCSGLPAWLPLYERASGRAGFEALICDLPLDYPPGQRAQYSDLGFILLGFILEDSGGTSLAQQFSSDVMAQLTAEPRPGADDGAPWAAPAIGFLPPAEWRSRIAPTETESWRGRLLVGEVHDANAWALGGVAGHAGLFGTSGAVGAIARAMLQAGRTPSALTLARPETVRQFTTAWGPTGSSHALGWDTMRPTSSCGTLMSPRAFGHTGFTGTSLWIDPDEDLYAVLLTNRVHPTREDDRIRDVRRAFHDAVWAGRDLD